MRGLALSTAPRLHLHLFHARKSSWTVILRQGPTTTYRMILWDRDSDRFHDGQWLKHKVYVERCDLSPDGKHFLYFTLDGQWGLPTKGSYTVICKPPYFTALRLYPQGDTWGGGGYFIDPARFYVHAGGAEADIVGGASGLERVFGTAPTPSNPAGLMDAKGKPLRLDSATTGWLAEGRPVPAVGEYETEGACLYRRKNGTRHLIRDFGDMAFEPIIAPYEPSEAWHPLNGDRR
jgi:hypothetical protein